MKLERIQLLRTPGIDDPFAVEFGPGLTVVTGPNASGKSSLVRAVRALLWPGLERIGPLSIRALWKLGEETWTVERDGKRPSWQRDGRDADPPPVPGETLARCFSIGAEDLLALDGSTPEAKDSELADVIAREMLGGYDLGAVRALFQMKSREGASDERALREAREDLRRCQRAHAELAKALDARPGLERRLAAARIADTERQRIETALKLAAARRAQSTCAERLARFPAGMQLVGGNERQRLRELTSRLEREERELREAQRAAESARTLLGSTATEDRPSSPSSAGLESPRADERAEAFGVGALRELSGRVERLRTLEHERTRLRSEREAEEARTEALRARLGIVVERAGAVLTEPADLAALDAFLRRSDELARKRAEYAGRLESEGSDADTATLADLHTGQAALLDWLRSVDEPTLLRWRLCIGALALLAAAGATALAVLHHPAWALLGLPVLTLWILALRGEGEALSTRRRAARAFLGSGLETPLFWEREEVEERLRGVQEELARAELGQARAARTAEVRGRLDRVELEEEELAEQRDALEQALGARAPSDLALAATYGELLRWRTARDACAAARAVEAAGQREFDAELARVADLLARCGEPAATDAPAAAAAVEELRERQARHRSTLEELAQSEERIAKLRLSAADARAHWTGCFDALELEPGDEDGLALRVEALESFRAENESHIEARAEVRRLEEELGDAVRLLETPLEALRARSQELVEQSAERDELTRALTSLDHEVQQARVRGELEEAIARERDAARKLEEQRQQALESAAGSALVEFVDREHGKSARPDVLASAQRLFAAFTRHAFELVVERGLDGGTTTAFRAIEASTGRGRALHELSSATRMQLLLAARLAFVEDQEKRHGVRLPLFFDEALSLSDPARFRAVAEALHVLVGSAGERQVVYLSSDPADVARFEIAGGSVTHVDLAAVRRLASAVEELPAMEITPALPDPRGMEPEAWARRIGVPALEPRGALESVHLFYVLRDELPLLKRLLELGVETQGQLRVLREASATPGWLDDGQAARTDAWTRVVREVFAAWRIGRGDPVTREVLAAAGVSERFLANLTELAADLGGEAGPLIEALEEREDERAKGFLERKREELREHLEKHGHLDQRPRLSSDQARARVLDALRLDLERGTLSPTDLRRRFEWLWHLCDPRARLRDTPALPFPDSAPAATKVSR